MLAALAVSALAPALAGAAFTGRAHGWVTAAVLLAGAIAAGTQGTAATRRDSNDPALRRLLGADAGATLVARAVLPALLGAAWLVLALALLAATGELPGALWPVLGLAAGPGLATAALRIARTAPINPADQGPDAPVTAPPWLLTRAGSVLLAWPRPGPRCGPLTPATCTPARSAPRLSSPRSCWAATSCSPSAPPDVEKSGGVKENTERPIAPGDATSRPPTGRIGAAART